MKLSKLKALLNAASKDQTRDRLCGVCIKREGKRLLAMATDGHLAVKGYVESETLLAVLDDGERIFLTHSDAKALSAGLSKKEQSVYDLLFAKHKESEASRGVVMVSNFRGVTVRVAVNGDAFPLDSAKQFFKIERASPVRLSINPELLVRLVEAMRDSERQVGVTLEFDLEDTGKAVAVMCGETFEGLAMPMRLGDLSVNDKTLEALRGSK